MNEPKYKIGHLLCIADGEFVEDNLIFGFILSMEFTSYAIMYKAWFSDGIEYGIREEDIIYYEPKFVLSDKIYGKIMW